MELLIIIGVTLLGIYVAIAMVSSGAVSPLWASLLVLVIIPKVLWWLWDVHFGSESHEDRP